MKILVFAHRLDVGGTQVNTIDLSAALRDRCGHDVAVFATPGPMSDLLKEKGLRWLPAPDATTHPSLPRMKALLAALRQEAPDLLHVWDWPQALDSFYVARVRMRIPMVVTCMSMTVVRQLPRFLPTTFGTPELVEQAKSRGWADAHLLLPPVDTGRDDPAAVDCRNFKAEFAVRDDDVNLVTVSRLVDWMKAESIRETIEVVRTLGRLLPLRLFLVGDGTSRVEIEKLANQVNSALGRQAIVLTGAMLDPRPAYRAATIVVGMGGSALRGMSFAKPVIIVGERGFARPLLPDTADSFLYQGIYGLGNPTSQSMVLASIKELLSMRGRFDEIGSFSRAFVLKNFALDKLVEELDRVFRRAVTNPPSPWRTAIDSLRLPAIRLRGSLFPRRPDPPVPAKQPS